MVLYCLTKEHAKIKKRNLGPLSWWNQVPLWWCNLGATILVDAVMVCDVWPRLGSFNLYRVIAICDVLTQHRS